ncbi:MAG: LacI family DNA-binding transcriptional regulator [Elusimicrobia bacterium]|nr:LacI family DNA-binding transcriptional regulator [Elusimicrobiota bacterium]
MKKYSIKDVARIAKVSTATVSRVVNLSPLVDELTRERVQKVIEKLNYHPDPVARSLIRGKSNLLTLIVPPEPNFFSAYYFTQTLCGISEALTKQQYRLMIYQPDGYDSQQGYPASLAGIRTDGLFIIAPLMNDRLVKSIESERQPVILINAHSPILDWIDLENVQVSTQVVDSLVGLGHRKIAFIGGIVGFNTVSRLEGYRNGLEKHSIPYDEKYVVYGDYSLKSGYESAKKLISLKEKPTAIFAANDEMAIGAIRAATESGLKVPGQISVFGFDDADIARMSEPSLSTVHQPFYEMGKRASEVLIARIENPEIPQNRVVLTGEMMLRKSTAPVQNGS